MLDELTANNKKIALNFSAVFVTVLFICVHVCMCVFMHACLSHKGHVTWGSCGSGCRSCEKNVTVTTHPTGNQSADVMPAVLHPCKVPIWFHQSHEHPAKQPQMTDANMHEIDTQHVRNWQSASKITALTLPKGFFHCCFPTAIG